MFGGQLYYTHFKHLLNCLWDHRCILHVFLMRVCCKISHNSEATSNLTFLIWPYERSQMLKFHLTWKPNTRIKHSNLFFRENYNRVRTPEVENKGAVSKTWNLRHNLEFWPHHTGKTMHFWTFHTFDPKDNSIARLLKPFWPTYPVYGGYCTCSESQYQLKSCTILGIGQHLTLPRDLEWYVKC